MVTYGLYDSSSSSSPEISPPSGRRRRGLRTPTPTTVPARSTFRSHGSRMPGAWLRSPTPGSSRFAKPQRSEGIKPNSVTETIPQPARSPRSPPCDRWEILPARTPGVLRQVRNRKEVNYRTRRELKLLQRQRNQPTILRLRDWNPPNAPIPPPQPQTWARFLSSWCRFACQPFTDTPRLVWSKELTFETTNDGNLSDWLDALDVLHAMLWLHRGRTFTDRNWYLSEAIPTPRDPLWIPVAAVVHGKIDPEHILYNKTKDPKRPYGDTKLFVPTDSKILRSVQDKSSKIDLSKSTTHYSAPELTWLKPKRGAAGPIGARSDIWSIGAVCVRMMGGPYYQDQPHSWYDVPSDQHFADLSFNMYEEKNMSGWQPNDLPKEYSHFLRAAVASLLVFRPLDRPEIEEAIVMAREHFISWRRRVRSSRPESANQDIKWITPSLYRNRAPRRERTYPKVGDDDYDIDLDSFRSIRSPLVRMFEAQEAAGDL